MTDERDHLAITAVGFVCAAIGSTLLGVDAGYAISACIGAGFAIVISDFDNAYLYRKRKSIHEKNQKKLDDAAAGLRASFEAKLARISQLERAFEILRGVTEDLPGPVFTTISKLAETALKDKP